MPDADIGRLVPLALALVPFVSGGRISLRACKHLTLMTGHERAKRILMISRFLGFLALLPFVGLCSTFLIITIGMLPFLFVFVLVSGALLKSQLG